MGKGLLLIFGFVFMVSCGDGGDSPAANAKKVCKCYNTNASRGGEERCNRMLEKYEAKYAENERRLNKFYDALDKCEGGSGGGGGFGLSVCDCVEEAGSEEPDEDMMEACKQMMQDADEADQKRMMEEARDCMKTSNVEQPKSGGGCAMCK